MADFDALVRESQAQVAKNREEIAEMTARIESVRAKIDAGEQTDIDIETATFKTGIDGSDDDTTVTF